MKHKTESPICPKCKHRRWKTLVRDKFYECRNCGKVIKDIKK